MAVIHENQQRILEPSISRIKSKLCAVLCLFYPQHTCRTVVQCSVSQHFRQVETIAYHSGAAIF